MNNLTNAIRANTPGANVMDAELPPGADIFASLLGVQMAMGAVLPSTQTTLPTANALATEQEPSLASDGEQTDKPADSLENLLQVLAPSVPLVATPTSTTQPAQISASVEGGVPLPLMQLSDTSKPTPPLLLDNKNPLIGLGDTAKTVPSAPLVGQDLPDTSDTVQFLPLQAQHSAAAAAKVAPMPTLNVAPSITDTNWGKAMSEQVLSMVSMKLDKAQIQINPPQMGPVEITLKMNGTDQAQVLFVAATPATREALESQMHRLSSMLASSGIELTDSQVSSGQSGQQQASTWQGKQKAPTIVVEAESAEALTVEQALKSRLSVFV